MCEVSRGHLGITPLAAVGLIILLIIPLQSINLCKNYFSFLFYFISVSVHTCAYVCAGAHRGQKRASNLLEVELQEVESRPSWVLGTKLESSARSAGTLRG